MEQSIIYALITVLVVGALLLLVAQVQGLRSIKKQEHAELQRANDILQCEHCVQGLTIEERAALRSKVVKAQKRAARQRKAARRVKQ